MRNISFGQILVLLLICFLLFGDFVSIKKKVTSLFKKSVTLFFKQNKKKGS